VASYDVVSNIVSDRPIARRVIDTHLNPQLLCHMASYDVASNSDICPAWHWGLAYIARHVIDILLIPHVLSHMASYNVGSSICWPWNEDISHPQMTKEIENAKIAILTCPFEPPKPKTKHKIDIDTAEKYEELRQQEAKYFTDMVKQCKDSGATLVICQW